MTHKTGKRNNKKIEEKTFEQLQTSLTNCHNNLWTCRAAPSRPEAEDEQPFKVAAEIMIDASQRSSLPAAPAAQSEAEKWEEEDYEEKVEIKNPKDETATEAEADEALPVMSSGSYIILVIVVVVVFFLLL